MLASGKIERGDRKGGEADCDIDHVEEKSGHKRDPFIILLIILPGGMTAFRNIAVAAVFDKAQFSAIFHVASVLTAEKVAIKYLRPHINSRWRVSRSHIDFIKTQSGLMTCKNKILKSKASLFTVAGQSPFRTMGPWFVSFQLRQPVLESLDIYVVIYVVDMGCATSNNASPSQDQCVRRRVKSGC